MNDAGRDQLDGDLIVCRCEGIRVGDVRSAIQQWGARGVNAVKKVTRAGMGPCQGKTCASVVERILYHEAQVPPGTEAHVSRPPVRAVLMSALASAADGFETPTGSVSAAVLWGRSMGEPTVSLESGVDE